MSRIEAVSRSFEPAFSPLPVEEKRPVPLGLGAVKSSIARHPNAALAVIGAQRDTLETAAAQIGALRGDVTASRTELSTLRTQKSQVTDEVSAAQSRRKRWGKLATVGQFLSTASIVSTGLMAAATPWGIPLAIAGGLLLGYHVLRESGRLPVSDKVDNVITVASLVTGVGGSFAAARAGGLMIQGGMALVHRINGIASTSMTVSSRVGSGFAQRDYGNAKARLITLQGKETDISMRLSGAMLGIPDLFHLNEEVTRVAREAIQLGVSS